MEGPRSPNRGVKFLGSYLHQLDDKGRVSLPASFRREAADQRFVLIQAYPPALSLYPETSWLEVEERMRDLLQHNPDARMWVADMMSNAVEVSPDAQGRILVPARLKEAAELDGQVQLVGMIDKVDLWNPATFEQARSQEAGTFQKFAGKIFR
ncbi:MAG: division/cell wall cluster transcriptional repressor MraZ [Gemmatimonadota bacterium]